MWQLVHGLDNVCQLDRKDARTGAKRRPAKTASDDIFIHLGMNLKEPVSNEEEDN